MKPSEYPPMSNCWKRIGVWGRERPPCERLQTVIHCRNCEVFTRAGRTLLEREPPSGYQAEWAGILAEEKADPPTQTLSVVIFQLGGEWLALPSGLFAEITVPRPWHWLPHRKEPVLLGLVNIHGELQICVSLQALLEIPAAESPSGDGISSGRMVVLRIASDHWVFPADQVLGIHRLPLETLENLPVTVEKTRHSFSRAVFWYKDRQVALLDDEKLLKALKKRVSR